MTTNDDSRRQPTDQELTQAEQRVFNEQVGGILGLDGKPLGTTKVSWGPIGGVVWGVAFLFMDENAVAVLHLEPDDCQLSLVQVGPDTDPVRFMRLKVPPPQQQFAEPWSGAPGTLADLLVSRARHLAYVWRMNAAVTEGLTPDTIPDDWAPPPDVQAAIDAVHAISIPDVPTPPGMVDQTLLEAALGELERTRVAVAAVLDAEDDRYTAWGQVRGQIADAVWPAGRENYPTSAFED